MAKPLSVETLLANPNTRPVMGSVEFLELTPSGGKGKHGKMFEVICDVREEQSLLIGVKPRKHQAVSGDNFGHLISDQHIRLTQRQTRISFLK